MDQKDKNRLSRILCSLSTDYKFRNLSLMDQAGRLISYGYSVEQVLKFWDEPK